MNPYARKYRGSEGMFHYLILIPVSIKGRKRDKPVGNNKVFEGKKRSNKWKTKTNTAVSHLHIRAMTISPVLIKLHLSSDHNILDHSIILPSSTKTIII